MSDIKDEISVNIDTAAKSVDMIKDYYYREHKRNKDRIKCGIIAMLVIPIIFLTLLFVVNSSKVIFLVMWIASLFIIRGYLIAIEYKDYNMKSTGREARAFILYTGVIILMSSRLFYPVSWLPLLLSA